MSSRNDVNKAVAESWLNCGRTRLKLCVVVVALLVVLVVVVDQEEEEELGQVEEDALPLAVAGEEGAAVAAWPGGGRDIATSTRPGTPAPPSPPGTSDARTPSWSSLRSSNTLLLLSGASPGWGGWWWGMGTSMVKVLEGTRGGGVDRVAAGCLYY